MRSQLLLVLVAAAVFASSRVAATTLIPADFAEMVTASDVIVHGTVVDVHSQLTAGRRTIESLVTVRVIDALKGTPGEETTFRVPNGQVGRYRRIMVGAPEFAAGQEVILFLSGRAPALPMPFGLSQGVYRVARDGARAIVTPAVPDAAGRIVRGDPSRRPLSPEAFANEVRTLLGAR